VAAGVAIVAVFSGGGAAVGKPARGHALKGTFTLFGPKVEQNPCATRHGYADVAAGLQVAVRDEHGSAVGFGSLSSGSADTTRRGCTYRFTVRSLPDAHAYTVEVGKRGGLTYSFDDLAKTSWKVDLNLGTSERAH
jgi:hypothetical protein